MPVDGISNGNGSVAVDRQTFGAQVVSGTLDALNGKSPSASAPVDRQSFGAAVVSGTLDAMNTDPVSGKTDPNYEAQKKVLEAHATGTILDTTT